MRDKDREDPADEPLAPMPSRHEKSNDAPVKSEESNCEQGSSQIPTRWQRIKRHPACKTVAAAGIAVVGGALFVVVAAQSKDEIEQDGASVSKANQDSKKITFEGSDEGVIRKSPIEHSVGRHERSQRFGPGGAEARIIQVSPYSRGGTA